MTADVFAVAALMAVAAGCIARACVRQPRPLASRVDLYTAAARARLGTTRPVTLAGDDAERSGLALVFGPLVRRVGQGLARLVDASSTISAELRLRQAGLTMTVDRYRT